MVSSVQVAVKNLSVSMSYFQSPHLPKQRNSAISHLTAFGWPAKNCAC